MSSRNGSAHRRFVEIDLTRVGFFVISLRDEGYAPEVEYECEEISMRCLV